MKARQKLLFAHSQFDLFDQYYFPVNCWEKQKKIPNFLSAAVISYKKEYNFALVRSQVFMRTMGRKTFFIFPQEKYIFQQQMLKHPLLWQNNFSDTSYRGLLNSEQTKVWGIFFTNFSIRKC